MDTHLVSLSMIRCYRIVSKIETDLMVPWLQSPHLTPSSAYGPMTAGAGGSGGPPNNSAELLNSGPGDSLHTQKPPRPPPSGGQGSKGSMLLKHLGPFLDSGSNLKILDLLAEKRKELAAVGGDIKPDLSLGGLGSNNSSASTSSSTSSGPKNAKRSRRYEEQDPLTWEKLLFGHKMRILSILHELKLANFLQGWGWRPGWRGTGSGYQVTTGERATPS